jgi:L-ascorbate metabolism protein UlaG (beta-lactamase superfamily)
MQLPEGLEITFLGHASFRIGTTTGKIIYMDAWLKDNPACPETLKTVERADLFLVTHGHTDHLDPELPEILKRTGAKLVAPAAVQQFLRKAGVEKIEMINVGGTIDVDGLKITATQAFHASNINTPEGPAYPHEPFGFVVEVAPGFRIYHAGDTGLFGDMALIGELYHPDVAMLPIGDRATMGPLQASYAARMLDCRVAIPIHFGTFPMLTGTAEEFTSLLADNEEIEVKVMKPGETWSSKEG